MAKKRKASGPAVQRNDSWQDVDLGQQTIRLPWGKLSIAAILSIITFLGSSAYLLLDKFLIQPEVEKRRIAENLAMSRNAEIADLKKQRDIIEASLRNVTSDLRRPSLLSPPNNDAIIADTIEFKWQSAPFQKYDFIELRGPRRQPYRFQILHPEEQLTHIPRRYLQDGEFFWRIAAGTGGQGVDAIEPALASAYSRFTLHESTTQRIIATGDLRIGLTATFEGPFNYPGADGQLIGIDIELIHWLCKAIAEELNLHAPLRPLFFNMAWQELLPSLSRGSIDVIVSHMTASQSREAEHPNVKFSKSYLKVGVALLSRSRFDDFWSALKGRTVGAVKDSTNEKAASYLADKYGSAVNNRFGSTTEAILALDRGEVDFVLTDEAFLSDFPTNKGYYTYKDGMSSALVTFYKSEYGQDRDGDELAVAVNVLGSGTRLLESINSAIKSRKGQDFLKEEEECWFKRGKYACENSKRLAGR
jgi:ABC-type amino acid transport substrate-binding protein